MAEIKWIKLSTDIFNNRKIKEIEKMPEGDALVVIWIKLLCLAGEVNDSGFVYFTKEIPYTDQMLSTAFDRPLHTVQLAMQTFERFGMIEVIENVFAISNWEKYQNVDRLAEIREYNRIAKQKSREKQKLLQNVNDKSMTSQRCHETDIDKDIDKDKEFKNILSSVVAYLNQKTGKSYKTASDKTRTLVHARLAEGFTEADFRKVIDNKCVDWKGSDMEQYLRPETLFGTKFEGYLNEKVKTSGYAQTAQSMDDLPF